MPPIQFTFVFTESSDWYIVPVDRVEEFERLESRGDIPDWAFFTESPERISMTGWEVRDE